MSKSFWITPTRLMRHKSFHQSIALMKTVNPNQKIVVPEETVRWIRSNTTLPSGEVRPVWATLPAEAVAMVMEHYQFSLSLEWARDPVAAQNLMDECIKKPSLEESALQNPFLYKGTFNTFVENVFPNKPFSHQTDVAKNILQSLHTDTYHIQFVYEVLLKNHSEAVAAESICGHARLKGLVPDYIVRSISKWILTAPSTYYTDYSDRLQYMLEACNRGIFGEQHTTKPVVYKVLVRPEPGVRRSYATKQEVTNA